MPKDDAGAGFHVFDAIEIDVEAIAFWDAGVWIARAFDGVVEVGEFFHVGDEAAAFECVDEFFGDAFGPAADHRFGGESIEGGVDFDGGKLGGEIFELETRGKFGRIEMGVPGFVSEAAGADVDLAAFWHFSLRCEISARGAGQAIRARDERKRPFKCNYPNGPNRQTFNENTSMIICLG